MTASAAAKHFKCRPERVEASCREFGVNPKEEPPVHRKVDLTAASTFEILAMLIQGRTQVQIAEEMCVSRQRVEQIQRKGEKACLLGEDSIVVLKGSSSA